MFSSPTELRITAAATAAALSFAFGAVGYPGTADAQTAGDYKFGVYDPEGTFSDRDNVQIEHLFLPWEDVELDTMYQADAYARERGRSLLVTIEPWTWSRDERNTPEYLKAGIHSGLYDQNMVVICQTLNEMKSPVTVRWAHEMDDKTGQFIWSGWAPETYIAAYRRMIDICRKHAPNAKYMWSPFGEPNLKSYYPGDNYVDIVGLTVFGLQKYDNDKFGRDRTFTEILRPGYDLADDFGKPICVAELGYVGNSGYVDDWNRRVNTKDLRFPDLSCSVYFNQKEVYAWPEDYGYPDWRVNSNIIE
ncbi:MAG: glycosyl hydrolase [Hyphomicrobiales bacterium]|jgi:endoglucanase|nr:glycosyl hydrolase [Hyphomicrobiales bacterium]